MNDIQRPVSRRACAYEGARQLLLLVPLAALLRSLLSGVGLVGALRQQSASGAFVDLQLGRSAAVGIDSAPDGAWLPWELADFHLPSDDDVAGWTAWQANMSADSFAPSLGRALRPLRMGDRYFVTLNVPEGFGAWTDAVQETLDMAALLNRTWVEPCVRNGCIEPCRCGAVRPSVRWSPARAAAAAAGGADPGALPRVDVGCRLDEGRRETPLDFVEPAYALSAYVDVGALLANRRARGVPTPNAIAYADWCAAYAAEAQLERDLAAARWRVPHGWNAHMQAAEAHDSASRAYGDFVFARTTPARYGTDRASLPPEARLAALAGDSDPALIVFGMFRGFSSGLYTQPPLPVSRWHSDAAAAFVREELGGPPYAAFHWRSEHADPALFASCAETLADIAEAALPPPRDAGRGRAVLLADMPAPANAHRMWNDYKDKGIDRMRGAMGAMLARGFAKIDAYMLSLRPAADFDAGIFSIRDYALAVDADWYVTCQGNFQRDCHSCFRSGSNLVKRIYQARGGRPASDKWFNVTAAHAPPSLGAGRVLPTSHVK